MVEVATIGRIRHEATSFSPSGRRRIDAWRSHFGPHNRRRQQPGRCSRGAGGIRVLGRSDQDGPNVVHYGYLTQHLRPLRRSSLQRSECAHGSHGAVHVHGNTILDSRHEHGNIITTSAPGELIIYLNVNPGADFGDPGSFALGAAIASYSVRYHNVLNVQAPNTGVITASVELKQRKAKTLAHGDNKHRFGRPGLRARLAPTARAPGLNRTIAGVFPRGGSAVVTGP